MAAVNMTNGTPVKQLFLCSSSYTGEFVSSLPIMPLMPSLPADLSERSAHGDRNGKSCHEYTDPGISGLRISAGVIMSSCFGAGRIRELKDELATALFIWMYQFRCHCLLPALSLSSTA